MGRNVTLIKSDVWCIVEYVEEVGRAQLKSIYTIMSSSSLMHLCVLQLTNQVVQIEHHTVCTNLCKTLQSMPKKTACVLFHFSRLDRKKLEIE